ncbi:hypothetical protein Tco_1502064 [Tanacetum coccineum]
MLDPSTSAPQYKRGRPRGCRRKQRLANVGKEKVIIDEGVDNKEVWDNVKITDEICDDVKAKYGKDYKNITDEQIIEFIKTSTISKGKQVEVIIISDDDTKDDAFSVSDSKDDDTEADDIEVDDDYEVGYCDIVVKSGWMLSKLIASTSKVSKGKQGQGKTK